MDIYLQIQFEYIFFISAFVPLHWLPAPSSHRLSPGYNSWDLPPSSLSWAVPSLLKNVKVDPSPIDFSEISVRCRGISASFEKTNTCADVGCSKILGSVGIPQLHGGNPPLARLHQTHGPGLGVQGWDMPEDAHIPPAVPSSGRTTTFYSSRSTCWTLSNCSATYSRA